MRASQEFADTMGRDFAKQIQQWSDEKPTYVESHTQRIVQAGLGAKIAEYARTNYQGHGPLSPPRLLEWSEGEEQFWLQKSALSGRYTAENFFPYRITFYVPDKVKFMVDVKDDDGERAVVPITLDALFYFDLEYNDQAKKLSGLQLEESEALLIEQLIQEAEASGQISTYGSFKM